MATKFTIFYFFILATVFNLPFIIPNIYFSFTEPCLQHWPDAGPPIGMLYWLQVQQWNQLAYAVSLLITSLHRFISQETKDCLLIFSITVIVFNLLFEVSWIVVGSLIFWSNRENECRTSFNIFMYCQLISFYLTSIFFVILCRKYFLQSQFKEEEEEPQIIGKTKRQMETNDNLIKQGDSVQQNSLSETK